MYNETINVNFYALRQELQIQCPCDVCRTQQHALMSYHQWWEGRFQMNLVLFGSFSAVYSQAY